MDSGHVELLILQEKSSLPCSMKEEEQMDGWSLIFRSELPQTTVITLLKF